MAKILIEQVRLEKGVSLSQLAKQTGIPVSTLSDYEKEKYSPRIDRVEKIAIALGVSIAELFESEYM